MTGKKLKSRTSRVLAGIAIVFGVLTVLSGGSVLFMGETIRVLAGETVLLALWFNFLSGFIYILTGYGIARKRTWATRTSILLTTAIALVFALLGLHILQGGAYEMRTVAAMTFRLSVWIIISMTLLSRKKVN
ncbi:MAG: hypothetical protein ABJL55_18620 [Roseibium sp.]